MSQLAAFCAMKDLPALLVKKDHELEIPVSSHSEMNLAAREIIVSDSNLLERFGATAKI